MDEDREKASDDIGMWADVVKTDIDGRPMDWDAVAALDLGRGIGAGIGGDPVDALRRDYDTRLLLERVMPTLRKEWMFDRDRRIGSYRLVRALAWCSRRLEDEIGYLEAIPAPDDLPHDPRADLLAWREENRKQTVGNGNGDWRDRYLPGRDVSEVIGIDLETTGLDPDRDYVIDSGWERMDMKGGDGDDADDAGMPYRDEGYAPDGAWGQRRRTYGVPPLRAAMGNPTEEISHLSADDLYGHTPLDEDQVAQRELLDALTSAPFVAHNASFEHRHFMSNVAGYAEAYRDGRITIIDTMIMSRKWGHYDDAGAGNDKLETYARRFGGLPDEGSERHLGLEDSHIMLLAMRNHLRRLHDEDRGPWGPDGIGGIGGKTCR